MAEGALGSEGVTGTWRLQGQVSGGDRDIGDLGSEGVTWLQGQVSEGDRDTGAAGPGLRG